MIYVFILFFLKRFYLNPYLHVQLKHGPLQGSKHLNYPQFSEAVRIALWCYMDKTFQFADWLKHVP